MFILNIIKNVNRTTYSGATAKGSINNSGGIYRLPLYFAFGHFLNDNNIRTIKGPTAGVKFSNDSEGCKPVF